MDLNCPSDQRVFLTFPPDVYFRHERGYFDGRGASKVMTSAQLKFPKLLPLLNFPGKRVLESLSTTQEKNVEYNWCFRILGAM